jgi:nicotinate-nucleotide--dimethylbenzimidazole phosphoribosyltransferase
LSPPFAVSLSLHCARLSMPRRSLLAPLGRIEALAVHTGLVTGSLKPEPGRAAVAIFAGDHRIADEGVTAYPSEVSALIAQMVLEGRAGANAAAAAASADVFLIDAGLKTPLLPHASLMNCHIGPGSRNFLELPAMTEAELDRAFALGAGVARELKQKGYGILALGEIGIGNSSAAAAVTHAVTGLPLAALVGTWKGKNQASGHRPDGRMNLRQIR